MLMPTSVLQEGIVDVNTPLGWRAIVGTIPIDVIDQALRICVSGPQSFDLAQEQEIDPRFVLASAWQMERLAAARQRAVEGILDDPIQVSGIQFPGLPTYYLVADGMHRTVAARLAGKKRVLARVSGCWECDPTSVKLIDAVPWYLRYGRWEPSRCGKQPDAVIGLLRSLRIQTTESWFFMLRGFVSTMLGDR
jgi:hypothetical protein